MILAACGTHHRAGPIATLGNDAITRAELDQYAHYVVGFDSLAYPDSAEAKCGVTFAGPACRRVRTQSLVRLLQERLIARYARRHGIHLTSDDQDTIDLELRQLDAGSAPTRRLFIKHTIDRSFMRKVLVRQLLVQKVQAAIADSQDREGFEYHVRRLALPAAPGSNRSAVRRQAIAITNGSKPPAGTVEKDEWVAPFRLHSDMRSALANTRNGGFAGPFDGSRSVFVLQRLGSGRHRYGAPARTRIQSHAFRDWLQSQARQSHLRCQNGEGTLAPCPPRIMNRV